MAADPPKKPAVPVKRPPARDTMTIPGQRPKGGSKGTAKGTPGPIQKPGRRRP